MGLDIYAGPVSRYVCGDWSTIVQQVGAQQDIQVEVLRPNQPLGASDDADVVASVVRQWQSEILAKLHTAAAGWVESADGPYLTDKPDWDGYGAVILLAAYIERPDLAPGAARRQGLRRRPVTPTLPRDYPDAEAFKAASAAPARFPTLLTGAEWCLPIAVGPSVFEAESPHGTVLTMGSVDKLLNELKDLNSCTLQLSASGLDNAFSLGPPRPHAQVDEVAPFGLASLLKLAEFAVEHRVAWIMDY
jgi:hypothetical protein